MAQTKTTSSTGNTGKRAPRTLAGSVPMAGEMSREQAMATYGAALQLMQSGKFTEAHQALEQLLPACPGDVADRVRVYMSACLTQITARETTFSSHEERFDYAVSLLNHGNYDDAREQFRAILDAESSADYAYYGLAVLCSMTGDVQTCLENLTEAIRLNPQNRIQARSDSDFQDMADDPRFTELLYPEV
ncbi:MAG: tetratricopeptide repeat protein [Acidobacteriota bacterium]|nr:tetratricopeptide repeat protein [Acidobacteriota bacterium]